MFTVLLCVHINQSHFYDNINGHKSFSLVLFSVLVYMAITNTDLLCFLCHFA